MPHETPLQIAAWRKYRSLPNAAELGQIGSKAEVWVARDDGRLMTPLPTFRPDLERRQRQAKIRVPRAALREWRSAQAVEGAVDPAASIVVGAVTSTL
jgi:hypothetical protein